MRNLVPGISPFVVALLLQALLCAQTPPSKGTSESVLLTLEGKVEVAPAGATSWSAARTNQLLQIGDRLRTGLRSRATLRLSDKSVLRVNELAALDLQPPPAKNNAPVLDQASGATYLFSRETAATVEV